MIRQATPADAELLARLRYEFRSMLDTPVESADAFAQRCTRWMSARLRADARWCSWIAESSGVAVGVVWLAFIEKIPNPVGELESYGYVTSFYVRQDHRELGIGSQLLAAALAECDRRRVHSAILWPTPRSRSLYARHGFAEPRTMMERAPALEPHHAT